MTQAAAGGPWGHRAQGHEPVAEGRTPRECSVRRPRGPRIHGDRAGGAGPGRERELAPKGGRGPAWDGEGVLGLSGVAA